VRHHADGRGADLEAGGLELPEAARRVDVDKVDLARELGLVDEAEVVVARYASG